MRLDLRVNELMQRLEESIDVIQKVSVELDQIVAQSKKGDEN